MPLDHTKAAQSHMGRTAYLIYMLSPSPNVVNRTVPRHPEGSFFLNRLLQKVPELRGMSP
ncbi:hypothetical protein CTA1_12043 [Colletotrichum tanaceti]|uniref:Uncharacterized protein n=1 Tax=Colletotrichum tanaceti TaxID=1306861 RepID=A0A4U6X985_9PEZI|nr:hypothetical protein CTA1_12043 [Colletotrichum tanaceti]